jgi:hypothetical protein
MPTAHWENIAYRGIFVKFPSVKGADAWPFRAAMALRLDRFQFTLAEPA